MGRTDQAGLAASPGTGRAAGAVLGDGVLNINKARGWTSHDVVAKLRRLLGVSKIGHAGTLDPAATGVLPILMGKGTRIAEYLLDWDKEYRAVLRLGETTDTLDATGTVLGRRPTDGLTEELIGAAVARFRGRVTQVPPMYSAVKVRGVPLYKAARAGRTIAREARDVTVHGIEVLAVAGRDVSLRIVCSKGTYIRTLCADIGEALGVGGHLLTLERRRVGPLTIDEALGMEEIVRGPLPGRVQEALMPLDAALAGLPALMVDDETARRLLHGVSVPAQAGRWELGSRAPLKAGEPVRLKDAAGRLLAIGKVPPDGLAPDGPSGRSVKGPAQPVSVLKVLMET